MKSTNALWALLGVFVFAGVAAPGGAQAEAERIGTIEATIDGEPGRWETLFVPVENSFSATAMRSDPLTFFSILGFPEDGRRTENQLIVEFTLMGDAATTGENPIVSYFPDGMYPHYTSSDVGEAEVSVRRFKPPGDDAEGHVEAEFRASICRQESRTEAPDPQTCRNVEGVLSTSLAEQEM